MGEVNYIREMYQVEPREVMGLSYLVNFNSLHLNGVSCTGKGYVTLTN